LKKGSRRRIQAGSDVRFIFLLILLVGSNPAVADDSGTSAAARLEQARLERVVTEHPADGVAQYQLGLVYRELGDNRSATLHLKAATKCGFDNLGTRLNLIEAAFASKQSALALKTSQQVISPTLRSAAVLLRVGRLLFDHLFYNDALRAFQLAQQAAPEAFEPRFRSALTDYLLEDYAATVAALKPVSANPEAVALLASAEAKLGHFETAISALKSSIAAVPQSPHAYINLALIDLDLANPGEAKALLEQFRSLQIQSDAKVFYTASHNSCEDVASAAAQASTSAGSSSAQAEYYYQLAAQLQERFNFLSAVQLIRLAQIAEGNTARVLLLAGTSCLNRDPLAPEAVALLHASLERDDRSYKAYYLLGRAYTRQGKLEDAAECYRRAADLHPDAAYYVSLGKALGDPKAAMAAFEQALLVDSSNAQAHLELGRSYQQSDRFDKARMEFKEAIDLEPDYYEAYYLLGRLLHDSGDEAQSHRLLTLFAEKKSALMRQSAVQSGYIGDGQ
jgi:tetratricopeptide (TPR) repeat protein